VGLIPFNCRFFSKFPRLLYSFCDYILCSCQSSLPNVLTSFPNSLPSVQRTVTKKDEWILLRNLKYMNIVSSRIKYTAFKHSAPNIYLSSSLPPSHRSPPNVDTKNQTEYGKHSAKPSSNILLGSETSLFLRTVPPYSLEGLRLFEAFSIRCRRQLKETKPKIRSSGKN
jgi:hypothetical protein